MLFPPRTLCCGFDQLQSIEVDITSSPFYGYLSYEGPSSWGVNRFVTNTFARPALPSTISLSSLGTVNSFRRYGFTNARRGIDAFGFFDFPVVSSVAVPNTGATYDTWVDGFAFYFQLRMNSIDFFAANLVFEVVSGSPRTVLSKALPQNPGPMPESAILSENWISDATSNNRDVVYRQFQNEYFNTNISTVNEICNCDGRARAASSVQRILATTESISLTSCGVPVSWSARDWFPVPFGATVTGTTLIQHPHPSYSGYWLFDQSFTITAIRQIYADRTEPLLSSDNGETC